MGKIFVSDKIACVVKQHIPNDGLALIEDLTKLFSVLLVQASNTAIQMYINQGVQIKGDEK